MNAKVTIEHIIENVCNPEDYGKDDPRFKTFAQVVKHVIKNESILGVASDKYRIVSIKESK